MIVEDLSYFATVFLKEMNFIPKIIIFLVSSYVVSFSFIVLSIIPALSQAKRVEKPRVELAVGRLVIPAWVNVAEGPRTGYHRNIPVEDREKDVRDSHPLLLSIILFVLPSRIRKEMSDDVCEGQI